MIAGQLLYNVLHTLFGGVQVDDNRYADKQAYANAEIFTYKGSTYYTSHPQIYPLFIPESGSSEPPYLVYQVISSQPQNTLDGPTGHEWARVQIDIYHDSYDDGVQLSHDVVKTLNDSLQLKIYDGTQQMYENDSKLFRQSIDIEFWQTTPTTPN